MTFSTTSNRKDYTGNGVTTAFAFPYRFLQDSDLVVIQTDTNGNKTTLVLGTGYTVTGAGSYSGGTVTLTTATPNLYTLTIKRIVALTQESKIRGQGAYYPEIHEDAFDKLTMIAQQQEEELARVIQVPASASGGQVLDAPVEGTVLGWVGGKLKNLAAATASLAANLLDSSNTALGAALVAIKGPLSGEIAKTQRDWDLMDIVDVRRFGSITGNQTNDQATILAAVAGVVAGGGGMLYIPFGASQAIALEGLGISGDVLILDDRWAKHDGHRVLWSSGRDTEMRVEGRATAPGEGPCFVVQNSDDSTAPLVANVTITIASPALLSTVADHNLKSGDLIKLSTTGALPTGLSTGTDYYVINTTAKTFNLALSQDAAAINTSGTQSGTHTSTQQKNRSGSVIFRSGPKATQKVQGVIKMGVTDSNGEWVNDLDLIPQYYSTMDQSVPGDAAKSRSRVRVGRRGSVLINAGVDTAHQDTDAAALQGIVSSVNSPYPMDFACTMTIASPCVVTLTSASGIPNGTAITLATTGALPTGLTAGSTYYVVGSNFKSRDNTLGTVFNLASTLGGTAINTTGSQSGTHTLTVTAQNLVSVTLSGLRSPRGVNAYPGQLVHRDERIPNITRKDMTSSPGALTILPGDRYTYGYNNSATVAVTLPNAAAINDGDIETVVFGTSVTTLTWASSGGSVVGAPATLTANTPYSLIYSEGSGGMWLPFR